MPRRTKKQSIAYGIKAVVAAGAVVGSMLGGKKIVGAIKKKVAKHRLKKFGTKGVGSSYKAKRFRKQNR